MGIRWGGQKEGFVALISREIRDRDSGGIEILLFPELPLLPHGWLLGKQKKGEPSNRREMHTYILFARHRVAMDPEGGEADGVFEDGTNA